MQYVRRPFALLNLKQLTGQPDKFQFSIQVLTSLGALTTRGWLYTRNQKSKRKLYAPAYGRAGRGYRPIITGTPHQLKVIRTLAEMAVSDFEAAAKKKEK
jgi:hypothetical protein